MFGPKVFERQGIGYLIGIESLPLIPDDRQSTAAVAAAPDVNQLARL